MIRKMIMELQKLAVNGGIETFRAILLQDHRSQL